jgi:hypothetical protein
MKPTRHPPKRNKKTVARRHAKKHPVSPLHKKKERPSNREFDNYEIEEFKYEHTPALYEEELENIQRENFESDNYSLQHDMEDDESGRIRYEQYPLIMMNESSNHYRYYNQDADDKVVPINNPSRYGEHHPQNYPYSNESLENTYPEAMSTKGSTTSSKNRPYRMTKNRRAKLRERVQQKREQREHYRARKKILFPSRGKAPIRKGLPSKGISDVREFDPVSKYVNRDLLQEDNDKDLSIRIGEDYLAAGYGKEYASPRRKVRSVNIHKATENFPVSYSDTNVAALEEVPPLKEKQQLNIHKKAFSGKNKLFGGKGAALNRPSPGMKEEATKNAAELTKFKSRPIKEKNPSGHKEHEASDELKKVSARKGGQEKSVVARKNKIARSKSKTTAAPLIATP